MSHTGRTYVVTGADGEIGGLAARALEDRGARVIRCGLGPEVDVSADLRDGPGRDQLVQEVARLAPGGIDGLVLAAATRVSTSTAVRVNFFGTLAVLAGLRTALRKREAPRVVIVSSASSLSAGDPDVVGACLRGDEEVATATAERAVARGRGAALHRSSKIALNRWVRRHAAAEDWAGTGVPVNVVAPGIVGTTAEREEMLADPDRVRLLSVALPQPLGLPGPIQAVADAIAWMIGPENSFMAGQIVFVDGGADAALRADAPYREGVRYGPVALARMLGYSARSKLRSLPRR